MSERNYYVICEDKCLFPAMTKEQTLAAIAKAMETGTLPEDFDTGFITKIREQNNGAALTFWVGTKAQYNAISEPAQNCFYIITDDTSFDDMQAAIEALQSERDISDEVTLDRWFEVEEDQEIEIKSYKFTYAPRTGLVHFMMQCEYKEAVSGERNYIFEQEGFLPTIVPCPVAFASDNFVTQVTEGENAYCGYWDFSGIYGGAGVMLVAHVSGTNRVGEKFTVSGSYFAAAQSEE